MTPEQEISELTERLKSVLDSEWIDCATDVVIDDLIMNGVCFRDALAKEIYGKLIDAATDEMTVPLWKIRAIMLKYIGENENDDK